MRSGLLPFGTHPAMPGPRAMQRLLQRIVNLRGSVRLRDRLRLRLRLTREEGGGAQQ